MELCGFTRKGMKILNLTIVLFAKSAFHTVLIWQFTKGFIQVKSYFNELFRFVEHFHAFQEKNLTNVGSVHGHQLVPQVLKLT